MPCRVEAASSVGHVISACCVKTLAGLSELFGRLSSHYEAQVKWNKRQMSNEHGSFVGVKVRVSPSSL